MEEEKGRFISRTEAMDLLMKLSEVEFFDDQTKEQLSDIATLIQYELEGLHFWNIPYEEADGLHTAYRDDVWTEDFMKSLELKVSNARFTPSKTDVEELKSFFRERCEETDINVNDEGDIIEDEFEQDFKRTYYNMLNNVVNNINV